MSNGLEMKHQIVLYFLMIFLLSACTPAEQLTLRAQSSPSPSSARTSTQSLAISATPPPTRALTPEATPPNRRIGLAQAEKLVRSWYEQQDGEFNASLNE
jgi:hypothetical protein